MKDSPSTFNTVILDLYAQIYGEFKDVVSSKYKQKVRSRISNLGDIKNPSLRQNVIWGHITPARIAVMTTDVRGFWPQEVMHFVESCLFA